MSKIAKFQGTVYTKDKVRANARKPKTTQTEYAEWLETFEWSHWCTFTTAYELSLKSARRLMEGYHKGMRANGFEPTLFWVAEKFELRDGWHTHGLLKTNLRAYEPQRYKALTHLYQHVCGKRVVPGTLKYDGWNRIALESYDRQKGGASMYCTKYVMKDQSNQTAEYDLLI